MKLLKMYVYSMLLYTSTSMYIANTITNCQLRKRCPTHTQSDLVTCVCRGRPVRVCPLKGRPFEMTATPSLDMNRQVILPTESLLTLLTFELRAATYILFQMNCHDILARERFVAVWTFEAHFGLCTYLSENMFIQVCLASERFMAVWTFMTHFGLHRF